MARPNFPAIPVQPDPTLKDASQSLPAPVAPAAEPAAVNVAAAMHDRMTGMAAARQKLANAKYRVERAKAEAERITAAIRAEELKRTDLKHDLNIAVDEMEAAVQEHDTATREHQAAVKALPVFGAE